MQHVLPKGFCRARNFGFWHPNGKRLIALLRLRVFKQPISPISPATPRPQRLCIGCGAPMRIVRRRILPSWVLHHGTTANKPEPLSRATPNWRHSGVAPPGCDG